MAFMLSPNVAAVPIPSTYPLTLFLPATVVTARVTRSSVRITTFDSSASTTNLSCGCSAIAPLPDTPAARPTPSTTIGAPLPTRVTTFRLARSTLRIVKSSRR